MPLPPIDQLEHLLMIDQIALLLIECGGPLEISQTGFALA
jgi:hypothetical protein